MEEGTDGTAVESAHRPAGKCESLETQTMRVHAKDLCVHLVVKQQHFSVGGRSHKPEWRATSYVIFEFCRQ